MAQAVPTQSRTNGPAFSLTGRHRLWGFSYAASSRCLFKWTNPKAPISYPRWWAALLFAAMVSIVGGGINSNLPAKPRELLKSVGLGFALDVATLLAKITPLPP